MFGHASAGHLRTALPHTIYWQRELLMKEVREHDQDLATMPQSMEKNELRRKRNQKQQLISFLVEARDHMIGLAVEIVSRMSKADRADQLAGINRNERPSPSPITRKCCCQGCSHPTAVWVACCVQGRELQMLHTPYRAHQEQTAHFHQLHNVPLIQAVEPHEVTVDDRMALLLPPIIDLTSPSPPPVAPMDYSPQN